MKLLTVVRATVASIGVDPSKRLFSKTFHYLGHIMSAISDFAAKQAEHNARMDAALTGLSGDIDVLNAKIAELQASPGAITAEDQALLDDLTSQGEALAGRVEAADALTPPVVPIDPPPLDPNAP
jgi:hypothetical protein